MARSWKSSLSDEPSFDDAEEYLVLSAHVEYENDSLALLAVKKSALKRARKAIDYELSLIRTIEQQYL